MTPTVLHVLEAFAGGTERHLLDLVRHVEDAEHVVAVPSRHLGATTERAIAGAQRLGARVELVEMTRTGVQHRNAAALVRLRRLVERLRPDVVHGHSSIGGALARLAGVGSAVPVVYTPNGLSRSGWALRLERSLRSRTDRLIAVSASEAEFALQQRLVGADRLAVIPNGLDLQSPRPLEPSLRQRLGVSGYALLVGCIGRLTAQKAPEVYVEACGLAGRQVADAHFLLIGSGPQREEVERAIRSTGLGGRFHWLAGLADAAAALAELDLYVLASRFEGGPYTPLEAMRAQTPVVLTDAAGNRDTVEDGRTGLLVPVDDPGALAGAIVELLSDPERRRAFGQAGRQRLADRFDVRAMGASTGRLYEALVSRR